MTFEIPLKLPSCNDYINECRKNPYAGANMKAKVEKQLSAYMKDIPHMDKPVTIHFHWIEKNKRRDFDNIAFAKKFILDALVKSGKLKDDNRKCVAGFTDTFGYGDSNKVILEIEEK